MLVHSLTTPKETRSRKEVHSNTMLQEMKSLRTRRLKNESQRRRPKRERRHAEVSMRSPTTPIEMKLRIKKGLEGGERGPEKKSLVDPIIIRVQCHLLRAHYNFL